MLGDPCRELDPLALEVLDGRLESRLRLEGYYGTATCLRPLGLNGREPDVEPVGVDLGPGPSCFITEKPRAFW